MPKLVDLSGKTFENLKVLERDLTSKTTRPSWKVLCYCGNIFKAIGNNLKSGNTVSCGCSRIKDLTNKLFGRLRALYRVENDKGKAVWSCLCACGNIKKISANKLTHKTTPIISCGCARKGNTSISYKHGLSNTKEYDALRKSKSRAHKRDNTEPNLSLLVKNKVAKFNNKCAYCSVGVYEHLDHVFPLCKGGEHKAYNIVPSCARCNLSKGSKILFEEWIPVALHPVFDKQVTGNNLWQDKMSK